jgi:hypothetical protein
MALSLIVSLVYQYSVCLTGWVGDHGGYRVEPFEGDPWDEELLKVPEAVDASGY